MDIHGAFPDVTGRYSIGVVETHEPNVGPVWCVSVDGRPLGARLLTRAEAEAAALWLRNSTADLLDFFRPNL
jgi:hypothetical protein